MRAVVVVLALVVRGVGAVDCSVDNGGCEHSCSTACTCHTSFALDTNGVSCLLSSGVVVKATVDVVGEGAADDWPTAHTDVLQTTVAALVDEEPTVAVFWYEAISSSPLNTTRIRLGMLYDTDSSTIASSLRRQLEVAIALGTVASALTSEMAVAGIERTVSSAALVDISTVFAIPSSLGDGEYLRSGDKLNSSKAFAVLEPSGNLAVYQGSPTRFGGKLWESGSVVTHSSLIGSVHAVVDSGNLLVQLGDTPQSAGTVLWQTSTSGSAASVLSLTAHGDLELSDGGSVLWSSSSAFVEDAIVPTVVSTAVEASGIGADYGVVVSGDSLTLSVEFSKNVTVSSAVVSFNARAAVAALPSSSALPKASVVSPSLSFSLPVVGGAGYAGGDAVVAQLTAIEDAARNAVANLPVDLDTGFVFSDAIISLGRDTAQTATAAANTGASWLAVNGNLDTASATGECAHVEATTNVWWRVDFGASATVDRVVVIGSDATTGTVEVRLGDDVATNNGNSNALCGTAALSPSALSQVVDCAQAQGRYLNVYLGDGDLYLCEVLVFGEVGCPADCSGNGVCGSGHTCSCNEGYEGEDCSESTHELSLDGSAKVLLNGRSEIVL